MKTFKQFIMEQSMSDLIKSDSRFSKGMKDFVRQNEINRQSAMQPTTSDPYLYGKKSSKKWDNETKTTEPNDVMKGSRYDLGGGKSLDPSKMSDKPNPKRELELRKDYRSPPAGYPKSIKDRLAGAEAGNEPPTPGSGPYKTNQTDPLKTPPIVPVTSDKPYTSGKKNSALSAQGYDGKGKRVTIIPKKTGIGRAETPLSSNIKIPSGPGITTSGSMKYDEPKKKITDRVPQSAVKPKATSAGPYAPAKSDDPFHQRYAKTASYLGQTNRERISTTDNVKKQIPIPKPTSTGILTKEPKKQTFKQAFAAAKEGSTFEWQGKKYKRITKKR